MSARSARTGEVVDPVREHLDKAENWLALAEGNRGELIDLRERLGRDHVTDEGMYLKDMMASAIQLAELHRAMAQTIYDLTPQRYALDSTLSVEAMGKALAEKMQADDEAHQAVTLRPGADPEPVAEGELWTTGDGWFYYTVAPASGQLAPTYTEAPRWLLVRHYAQVLRWSSEQSTKPMAYTWSEVADHSSEGGSVFLRPTAEREVVLRRPTAEERAAFYGPEPDPQPTPSEAEQWVGDIVPQICPICGGRHVGDCAEAPPATLGEAFRTPYGGAAKAAEGPVRFDATVAAFSDEALAVMRDAVKREQTRRGYTPPESRPRGGAAQWREG